MKMLNSLLIVDDNRADNFFHETIIEQSNLCNQIEFCTNGLDAINFLKQSTTPPDLILLDLNMPILNGWEFLEVYSKLPASKMAHQVIIMLGSYITADQDTLLDSFSVITNKVNKPISENTFKTLVDNFNETRL